MINKPLGLSPPHIEFKRAHLYDINPVGVGAMVISVLISTCAFLGLMGPVAQALSAFIGLTAAFAAAPLIAWTTGGKYYIARQAHEFPTKEVRCGVCENLFERQDMAFCTAYSTSICSLCCTLEARCRDQCKRGSRIVDQLADLSDRLLPGRLANFSATRLGQFIGTFALFTAVAGALFALIDFQYGGGMTATARHVVSTTLWIVFLIFMILSGITAWLLVLAHESRRAAERESERQTVTLMQEIEAHERTDAALQKAKEAAEAANFAKSRYIVGLSHEFRTPLNSIFGYAQLLEREPELPRQNPVRVIRRSAEHLSDLVDGLLDISRIETGTLHLDQSRFCLPDLLDQMADMFRLQAAARGIEFRYSRDPSLPRFVQADERRLRQVLINLLSNAIKYTEHGHAALAVRHRRNLVEFEISDTGMGIRPEDMEKIFEPFERGGMAPARAMPGTGLGLTITKLLTEVMGGQIRVVSTPGQGSCFTVLMLLFAALPAPEDSVVNRHICGYVGRTLSLLLADDDPTHLDFVRQTLTPLGFAIFTAQDGFGALALAAEMTPDVALLDISMPGMDGWQTAAALRKTHPGMKIMMVSANAHDFQTFDRDGLLHDAFLMKPFDLQRMLGHLQSLCGLNWIYEAPERGNSATASSTMSPAVEAPPAHSHIEELIHLGEIGYVHGIHAKLTEMAAESDANAALIAEARALLQDFRLADYLQLLKALQP